MKDYNKMTDKEINNLLEKLGKENWHTNYDLLKEGLSRWLKLSGFSQKGVEVNQKMKIKKGFYWHCHHDTLCEFVYDYEERKNYILKNKPKKEIEIRLKLFKKVKGKLPEKWAEAREKWVEARDKWVEAREKLDEAKKKWNEMRDKLNEVRDKLDETRAEYNEAWEKYNEARDKLNEMRDKLDEVWEKYNEARDKLNEMRGKLDEVWEKYKTQTEKLHKKECGCSEWNGKEIVFQ